jgi:hypothetical protein
MRGSHAAAVLLALAALAAVAACSKGSGSTCATEACGGPSPLSYQACGASSDDVAYEFGGQSCRCVSSDAAACAACKSSVIAWCEGLGDAGGDGGSSSGSESDSGSGSGGSGSGSGGEIMDSSQPPCTLDLTGALSGSFACVVSVTYSKLSMRGDVTISVANPGALQEVAVSVQQPGVPATGVWANTDPGASGGMTVQGKPAAMVPTWQCSVGGAAPQGTYSMNLRVGIGKVTPSGEEFGATGTLDANLPALAQTGATGTVKMHVAF